MYDHENYQEIPELTLDALDRWGKAAIPPGDFTMAVLRNDFMEVIARADCRNRQCLPQIAKYIYNELPSGCWGSPNVVKKWKKENK